MEDRQGPPQKSGSGWRGMARRLLGGAAWSAGITVALAALVLFALFACKNAGHR
jgi:hypothetical protein